MGIKIRESFKRHIALDPTKDSVILTIQDICSKVKCNKIVLPIFQTGLRWTEQKVISLLNFQLTGFAPVAPISMCNLDFGYDCNPAIYEMYGKQISLLEREEITTLRGEIYSLTDGQQRITTNYKCYIGHPDFAHIVLDVSVGKIITIQDSIEIKVNQIPVGVLYNHDFNVYNEHLTKHPQFLEPTVSNYLTQIRNKFLGYRYTVNFAKNLNEKQQLQWFEILNNAGSKIPIKEMNLSRLKTKDVDYHKDYIEKFMSLIEDCDYDECFPTQATKVTYPLSTLNPGYDFLYGTESNTNVAPMPSDVKEKRLCALKTEELKKLFNITLEALELVLLFIEDNDLDVNGRMEYITFSVGYFIYGGNKELTQERKDFLINWFKITNFVNMSNSTKRKTYQDLINMRKSDTE